MHKAFPLHKPTHPQLEKTKLYCEELTERLETSEYQISTISQEYRRLLHDKEDELNRVKADNVKLRQENKHLVNDTTPLKELAGDGQFFDNNGGFESIDLVGGNGEWMGEYPVNDVVTSRETITQLQSELTRVRAESEHWKSQAGMVSVLLYSYCPNPSPPPPHTHTFTEYRKDC